MQIIHQASELDRRGRRVCAAIGVFDAVHLGHQQVIRQMIADARQHEAVALVITFDRHPKSVLMPERAPLLIYPLAKKLQVIAELGVDATLQVQFDAAFSQIPAQAFIEGLARDLGRIQSVCVGGDFTFGHKRSGNVEVLRQLGAQLNFAVHGLAAVSLDGEPVSSTRIRQAIRAGDLDAATQMLGRGYSVVGQVKRGDEIGRTIGFPTANVEVRGLVLPPNGVYAAHALARGQIYQSVVNIGLRPTLNQSAPELRFEAHLLGFEGNLYGLDIEVELVDKLRDEQKMASLEALRAQIARDIAEARKRFEGQ